MIQITDTIAIDEKEIQEEFVRSSGPGGQNVNKVSTAVQLRFDLAHTTSLPEEVRERLLAQAHGYITDQGVLIIDARRNRTQEANRRDALDRLVDLLRKAAEKPRIRYKTKPTLASKKRRLENKVLHARTKQLRRPTSDASEG